MATDFLFNSIPNGWWAAHLGDVAEVMFSSVDKRIVDGETPVKLCNYTDVFNNRRIHLGMTFMAASAKPVECVRWELKKGDVLFTKDSETPDEIGIPAFVTEDMPGVLCGYHLARARPNEELVNGAFLAELIRSPRVSNAFARVSNGVTRFGLTLGAANTLPILLPPLAEQCAIAAVLQSIDGAIERTDDVIAATERLRDALLHELLTRGVPGWHSAWKDVPGLGTVPTSWEVVRLGEGTIHVGSGITPRGGRSVYTGSGVTFLRSQNVHFDGLRLDDVVNIPPEIDDAMQRSRVYGGDVLLNITGASIGRCTIATPDLGPANVNQHVCIVRVSEDFNPTFVSDWLSTSRSQREIDDMQAGQSRQGLNYQQVRQLKIVRPSRIEQDQIANIIGSIRESIRRATEHRARLQSTKAAASDALLTGRVRVGV